MFLSLLGSMCGYSGYRPLAQFVQKHHALLCQLLKLEPDLTLMPSSSTFRRIFQQVDAQAWVDSFNVWVSAHAPELSGQLLSIDGKSIRCTSSGGNTSAQTFTCLVSVYGLWRVNYIDRSRQLQILSPPGNCRLVRVNYSVRRNLEVVKGSG